MRPALVTTSHSPLLGLNQPAADIEAGVEHAFEGARRFIADFDPELVVVFAPDHYNGMFYDLMSPFCIGQAATAVGDYQTSAGPLDVDREASLAITRHVLASGVDVSFSERMYVDHGFAQPLEILFGSLAAVPVVPIFINSVAVPLGPVSRARMLGHAVGEAVAALDRRVLLLGSGGLSHDPPVPQLETASPETAERLISGRIQTPADRAVREGRVLEAGIAMASGTATVQPLNPEWDKEFLDLLERGDIEAIDSWTNAFFVEKAGNSSHEVRTWVASYAALAASGGYRMTSRFYQEIPEWIAGFAVTTAAPTD